MLSLNLFPTAHNLQKRTGSPTTTLLFLMILERFQEPKWDEDRHVQRDGYHWFATSLDEWSDYSGLTKDQVRNALKRLRRDGLIFQEQFYFKGGLICHVRLSPAGRAYL